jgi:ATP-dependent RNA helicase DDX55/SPB4
MPELKDLMQRHKGKLPHFTPAGPTVNIFAIPYADKAREQARQQRLAEELANGGGKDTKRMQAEQRKLEKEQKAKERRQKKNRSKRTRTADDWDSLALEERLHKQMKRGKITQAQLEARLEEGE